LAFAEKSSSTHGVKSFNYDLIRNAIDRKLLQKMQRFNRFHFETNSPPTLTGSSDMKILLAHGSSANKYGEQVTALAKDVALIASNKRQPPWKRADQ